MWKKRFRFVVAFLFLLFVLSAVRLFQLPLANDPQDELSRNEVRYLATLCARSFPRLAENQKIVGRSNEERGKAGTKQTKPTARPAPPDESREATHTDDDKFI